MKKLTNLLHVLGALCALSCVFRALPAGAAPQYGRQMQQMMSLQATADVVGAGAAAAEAAANAPLPVRVMSPAIEAQIRAGTVGAGIPEISALEKCGMIYPNGAFVWGVPDAGDNITSVTPTCLAEVELRAVPDGSTPGMGGDKTVAIAYVPAGGSIKCNIGMFPSSGYLPAAGEVTFPADNPPTLEDVKKVMDKEQKQNAGIKTATAALVGGAAMFFAAKDTKDTGKKIGTVAAGAVGAGGLAFASTQAGYVAGNTIMSVGVNAATGAVMGNMGAAMAGGGDSILLIKDCVDTSGKCLWGYVISGGGGLTETGKNGGRNLKNKCYYNIRSGLVLCEKEDSSNYEAYSKSFANIEFSGISDKKKVIAITPAEWAKYYDDNKDEGERDKKIYCLDVEKDEKIEMTNTTVEKCPSDNYWVEITGAIIGGSQRLAMLEEFGQPEGSFGITMKDFSANKDKWPIGKLVGRSTTGSRNGEEESGSYKDGFVIENFTPLTVGADDGDIIDFGNKTRMKGTLIGAGAGAAVGGLASFQGARTEVEERLWIEEQNYQGSLRGFYCITGTRHLENYNGVVVIPAMR